MNKKSWPKVKPGTAINWKSQSTPTSVVPVVGMMQFMFFCRAFIGMVGSYVVYLFICLLYGT